MWMITAFSQLEWSLMAFKDKIMAPRQNENILSSSNLVDFFGLPDVLLLKKMLDLATANRFLLFFNSSTLFSFSLQPSSFATIRHRTVYWVSPWTAAKCISTVHVINSRPFIYIICQEMTRKQPLLLCLWI